MLKIVNLTKKYGKKIAINKINLKVEKGEIFGIIGPNGAGKTTIIKCLLNFINKNEGHIYIDNVEMTKQSDYLKNMIGYVPSEINLYKELTVQQMINLSNSFYQKDGLDKANILMSKLKLENKKIEQLSLGNLKKLALILALMNDPSLVILDEATSGLDPIMQEIFYEIVLEEKKKGTTFFFSSHNLSEVKRICDRIAIIKDGSIITVDVLENLTKTSVNIVTLIGEYKKLKLPIKDIIIKEKTSKRIKFVYKGNINELLKIISDINLEKILIEEPTIDEMFIHYYK